MTRKEKLKIEEMWEMNINLTIYILKELQGCRTVKDLKNSDAVKMFHDFHFESLEAEEKKPFDNYSYEELPPESCDDYEWHFLSFDTFFPELRFVYDKAENTLEGDYYDEPDDEIAESFCELYGFDFYDKDIANHVHAQINKMWNAIKHQTTVEIC